MISNASGNKPGPIFPREVALLAGTACPDGEGWEPFAPQVIDFLDAFSKALRGDSRVKADPEAMALAFWCRRAHILSLPKRHGMEAMGHAACEGNTVHASRETETKPGDQDPVEIQAFSGLQPKWPGKDAMTGRNPDRTQSGSGLYLGRGRIFHLAPSNVPMLFAYTWLIGLLAGNAGIVRISERTLRQEAVQAVLGVIRALFGQEGENGQAENMSGREDGDRFARIRDRTSFITYGHSDAVTEQVLQHCGGRVLWGGDETVRRMRSIPMPAHAVELAFPDRVSIAVINEEALAKMDDARLKGLVHRFYNDTYIMDQNGCSSPQTVIWIREGKGEKAGPWPEGDHGDSFTLRSRAIRERWWEMLAEEAENAYELDGFRAARKLEKAALAAMRPVEQLSSEEEDLHVKGHAAGDGERNVFSTGVYAGSIRRYRGNALYVLTLSGMPRDLAAYKGGFGLFFEAEADSAEALFHSFSPRIQTVVCIGTEPGLMAGLAVRHHSEGVLRFVEAGQALQIDTIWDGTDLIRALSRRIC